jgi:uncharacterized membrane protein
MVSWLIILIGIVAILVVSKLIHFRHIKHRITAIFIILLLLFIVLTFAGVIHNNSIKLNSPAGIFQASKIYLSWLGHVFGNLKVLTGNVVRMDWFGNLTV